MRDHFLFASSTREREKELCREAGGWGIKFVVGMEGAMVDVSAQCDWIPRCEDFRRRFWEAVDWMGWDGMGCEYGLRNRNGVMNGVECVHKEAR